MAGVRLLVPPLRVRECADWMGLSPEWIRKAITEGVPVRGVIVKLEAETLSLSDHRRTYRIHEEKFSEFLQAIGWKHLPHRASAPSVNGQETAAVVAHPGSGIKDRGVARPAAPAVRRPGRVNESPGRLRQR